MLEALADEQAALRRVATFVARGASPTDVFAAVTREVVGLLGVDMAGMVRFEPGDMQTLVAAWPERQDQLVAGTRMPLFDGVNIARMVMESGQPARVDDWADAPGEVAARVRELGVRSSVGSPIVVAGELWGVMIVDSSADRLPDGTEARLENFTELVATAIANTDARLELSRLAAEQAALRRVATLVASAPSPAGLFDAVAEEVGIVLGADSTRVLRYDADGAATVVGGWGIWESVLPTGARQVLDGDSVSARVLASGRPARMDTYEHAIGPLAAALRSRGVRSSVGAPIVVGGRLWGAVIAGTERPEPLPADAETRIGEFTELVATAIANADGRAKLEKSRARVVIASDEARRRIERDLHDGAQQRLVSLGLKLRMAERAVPAELGDVKGALAESVGELSAVLEELRELSRGIHPASLTLGGLEPALGALAHRSTVPVRLDVRFAERPPERVEAAAYYVASEALANAAKHACASEVEITAVEGDDAIELVIRDDGVGGADPASGSGLIGLADRVEAIGGTIEVDSPAGAGTTLRVTLPR
jgi:signal transduction histidine kinase